MKFVFNKICIFVLAIAVTTTLANNLAEDEQSSNSDNLSTMTHQETIDNLFNAKFYNLLERYFFLET